MIYFKKAIKIFILFLLLYLVFSWFQYLGIFEKVLIVLLSIYLIIK
jgi:hypothetical protein